MLRDSKKWTWKTMVNGGKQLRASAWGRCFKVILPLVKTGHKGGVWGDMSLIFFTFKFIEIQVS